MIMRRWAIAYEMAKVRERVAMAIVWALPHWVIKWAVVRATATATTGQYGDTVLPEITAVDVLKRWG